MDVTVCVLLYGDHYDLACRCLKSLFCPGKPPGFWFEELRIGMNEACDQTKALVSDVAGSLGDKVKVLSSEKNSLKYPMMRRLFYETPLDTRYVMWFDDDSFIRDPTKIPEWSLKLRVEMDRADVIGSMYNILAQGNQAAWIRSRSWYNNVAVKRIIRFPQGAWWTARTSVLQKFNWPDPELKHCGGDVMFGEMCRQQKLRVVQFKDNVAINAGKDGKESTGERRGYSEKPIGV